MPSAGKSTAQLQLLDRSLKSGGSASIVVSGRRIALPKQLYGVLRQAARMMSRGRNVAVISRDEALTTQRAADILGMSRPFFVKLLEAGVMPHHRVGNQRRIYLRDVLNFAKSRDLQRHAALDRLSREAFEAGLYDRNVFPEGGQDM